VSDDSTLQAILDRFAIDDLLTAYADALDQRDWPRLSELFVPSAVLDFTAAYGRRAGRDDAIVWLSGQVTREFAPETQHLLTNRRWTCTGDRADGRADFFNPDVIAAGGEPFLLLNGGRYDFGAVRTPDGWRFDRLAGTVLWSHRGELLVFDPSGD
jgi:hypothetical protein